MTPTGKGVGIAGGELARLCQQKDRRRALWTGLLHGYGAAVLTFGAPMVSSVLVLGGDQSSALPDRVAVLTCLVSCAWMAVEAWRSPLWEGSTGPETLLNAALAGAVVGAYAITDADQGTTLEVLRAVVALALVVRLVLARGGGFRDLARGEVMQGRGPKAAGLVARRWGLSYGAIIVGTAISMAVGIGLVMLPSLVAGVEPDWGSPVVTWVTVVRSGLVEEIVAVAALVLALEYAKRPVWEIYAATITVRIAYHLWKGVPGCLMLIPLAVVATWAYRRWRSPTALAAGHTTWDAALTLILGPY